jgi:hypothetical protein
MASKEQTLERLATEYDRNDSNTAFSEFAEAVYDAGYKAAIDLQWVAVNGPEDYPPQGETVLWTRGSVVVMMGYLNGDGNKIMYPGGREFEWAGSGYVAWMRIPPYKPEAEK